MLSIGKFVNACKDKWHQYQEVHALSAFVMLVQTGTTESDAIEKINAHYQKQFDWGKLLSPEFSQTI